jgi:hypothetical protein
MVGLTATIDRIAHIRENRILALNASGADENYVDRANIAEEIAYSRKLCMKLGGRLSMSHVDLLKKRRQRLLRCIGKNSKNNFYDKINSSLTISHSRKAFKKSRS